MANYQPIDSIGSKNAMANISAQTVAQRNQFAGNEGILGASRTNMDNLFNHTNTGRDTDVNIASQAYNAMLDMYEDRFYTGTTTTLNPDFSSPLELGYDESPTAAARVTSTSEKKDKPNAQGPNIKSFGFDADGSPDIPANTGRTDTSSLPKGRGFGTEEGQSITIGSYLRRRWNISDSSLDITQRPKLGEHKDHSSLEYSTVPVFVEPS